jgi:hypothetical protein
MRRPSPLDLKSWCRLFSLLVASFLGTGCTVDPPAQPVTLQSWQHNLEDYVWEQANGDPNVLRDMSWDDVHHGFAIISDPLPVRSTDAIGLLVDHRRIENQPYFIFLFGLVRDRMLTELRPVALNVNHGRFRWVVGANDPLALELYRGASSSTGFPGPQDEFDLTVAGNQLEIVHPPSGARWRLVLTASTQPVE